VRAQVLALVADDADAVDGRVEVEADSVPTSAVANGAPTGCAAPVRASMR
jgi:hypothetical protein